MSNQIIQDLSALKNPQKAKDLSRFFKTKKGEYGEGDIFWGIPVPEQRKIAKKNKDLPQDEIQKLLNSKVHEHRLTALIILVSKYQKTNENERKQIFDFYLKNLANINNWDLVDLSAPRIVGDHLVGKEKSLLYNLARSDNLWKRRIAILSTFKFIANGDFADALCISELLLNDKHDLIHKAVGWALREIGKRDPETEEQFLRKHHSIMPRTMLRYAIEKLDEDKRKFYLNK